MNPLLDAALQYHAEGKPVVAVTQGKNPIDGFWSYRADEKFSDGTNDTVKHWARLKNQTEEDVRQEFSNGAYGVARILFPASNDVVLDGDGPHALEAWEKTGIPLPLTARNESQSGGFHLFLRIPEGAPTPAGIRRKVRLVETDCACETKCGVDFLFNGIVVVPPTPGYREDPDFPPESAIEIPTEILELVRSSMKTEQASVTGDDEGKIRRGKRHATAISLVGTMRRRGMSRKAIYAALKADSDERFEPPLTDDEVEYFTNEAMKWPTNRAYNNGGDSGNADIIREQPPREQPSYDFTSVVPTDHFISRWIQYASSRTDAAHEYHEAAALILLASALPNVRAPLSPYPNGLATNLYILFIGDSTTSRKSTSKDFAKDTQCRALAGSLSPDHFSPEGFIEHLAARPNNSTTLYIDEFSELLEKLHHAQHMAQMRGLFLTIYDGNDYLYKRHSKSKKGGDKVEDVDRVEASHLSILGATTPAIFESLTEKDVTSGLLPRFGIVMPAHKPKRRPFFEMADGSDVERNALVCQLANLNSWARATERKAHFAPDVLETLDKVFEAEFEKKAAERTESGKAMLTRLPAMTIKIAMLIAAGRGEPLADNLEVSGGDADAAIAIIRRWTADALSFAERIGENEFERKLQICLRLVRAKGRIRRKVIADRCHMEKRLLDMIQETLIDRGEINLITTPHQKGGPTLIEWEVSNEK